MLRDGTSPSGCDAGCGVRREGGTGLRGGAGCVTASGGFATEVSGQVGGAVVERRRRRVVSFAWIVSSWPSAWQRCAARLN